MRPGSPRGTGRGVRDHPGEDQSRRRQQADPGQVRGREGSLLPDQICEKTVWPREPSQGTAESGQGAAPARPGPCTAPVTVTVGRGRRWAARLLGPPVATATLRQARAAATGPGRGSAGQRSWGPWAQGGVADGRESEPALLAEAWVQGPRGLWPRLGARSARAIEHSDLLRGACAPCPSRPQQLCECCAPSLRALPAPPAPVARPPHGLSPPCFSP